MDPTIEEALSIHGARFRTINIQVSDLSAMQEAFVLLADNSVPGSLTELSAWLDCYEGKDPPFPSAEDFIFHEDTLRRASFGRIMNSLRVLRLKSVNIHMTNISFEYLAELRLQELALGHEAVLHGFLRALASASQLRDLEIISVIAWTNHIDDDDEDQDANQPDFLVFLPNLRRLFIEGLYGNVIRTVLHSIAPGPFSLVISLTDMCRYIKTEHETWICGENPLKSAVKDHIVDTVMLGNLFPMLEDVTPVLSAIPTATTLYIDDQYLSGVSLLQMTRTRGTNSGRSALPKFRAIHISRSIIDSLDHPNAFQNMIASYPLQELTLGGAFGDGDDEDEEFDFDGSDERVVELMDWFDARIPDFTVVGRHHFNVWFQTDVWQLW
ncbi:hypothetical protein FRC11_000652 [Ceratobasidium sp. 423]|nr:hypothetical protein FRC11_000652 [Ceratobasidium sp. 423]